MRGTTKVYGNGMPRTLCAPDRPKPIFANATRAMTVPTWDRSSAARLINAAMQMSAKAGHEPALRPYSHAQKPAVIFDCELPTGRADVL
jgi:hypothetical protein